MMSKDDEMSDGHLIEVLIKDTIPSLTISNKDVDESMNNPFLIWKCDSIDPFISAVVLHGQNHVIWSKEIGTASGQKKYSNSIMRDGLFHPVRVTHPGTVASES
jgi:hypothetical protein